MGSDPAGGLLHRRGECRVIEEALEAYNQKIGVPHVILERGRIVGRVTLSNIVRGPFQSCNLRL